MLGRRMLTASNLMSLPGQAQKAQPPAQVPKEPRLGVMPVLELEREDVLAEMLPGHAQSQSFPPNLCPPPPPYSFRMPSTVNMCKHYMQSLRLSMFLIPEEGKLHG